MLIMRFPPFDCKHYHLGPTFGDKPAQPPNVILSEGSSAMATEMLPLRFAQGFSSRAQHDNGGSLILSLNV